MKTKILILNVEPHLHKSMLDGKLKSLTENYEIVFADSIVDALDKIAKAHLI